MPYKDKKKQAAYQLRWMKQRRLDWLRDNGPCIICGSRKRLQIDHVDPKKKVSHRIWSYRKSLRVRELKKCQVLCLRCHKKKTTEDRRAHFKHGSRAMYKIGCKCRRCVNAQTMSITLWKKTGKYPRHSSVIG